MRPRLPLMAAWLAIQASAAQTAPVTVEEILASVQTNTGQFEQALPDFVCDEKLDSKWTDNHGSTTETIAESHFTGRQKKAGRLTFVESRDFITVNGKPVKRGQTYRNVFIFGGGFSSLLDQTFSAEYAPYQDYEISGQQRFNGRAALVIEFATKLDQTALRSLWNGQSLVQRDRGKAWIEQETMQVLRIERHFFNLPTNFSAMDATVDYGPVSIEGKPFWMPLGVRCEQRKKGGGRGIFTAEYRNYRKFEVESGISYEPVK